MQYIKEYEMAGRNGQEVLTTWVSAELATAFKAQARVSDGGTAAALRRLVTSAVQANPPVLRGVRKGEQVGVRFKETEHAALAKAAQAQGTSPANWLRSLALVHLQFYRNGIRPSSMRYETCFRRLLQPTARSRTSRK